MEEIFGGTTRAEFLTIPLPERNKTFEWQRQSRRGPLRKSRIGSRA